MLQATNTDVKVDKGVCLAVLRWLDDPERNKSELGHQGTLLLFNKIFNLISSYLNQGYSVKIACSCLWGAAAKSVILPAPVLSFDVDSDVVGGKEEGYFSFDLARAGGVL